ncbi:MAG TPA: hypothetical protein VEN81_02180, partial [Planctomycetota bacterium]|nr:hypothetical protein [Planctomycetota bacterium]
MKNLLWWSGLFLLQEGPPLGIGSITAHQDPTRVVIVWNRPVEQGSAELPGNYTIEPGIRVESAARSALDLKVVTLKVSPLAEGVGYTLSVHNVRDCGMPPSSVGPEQKKAFSFTKSLVGSGSSEEPAGPHRPPMPKFKAPVLFNTPEADEILAALQVFPKNNPWNEDITKAKVHPNSA